jgi:hypothetical protein
MPKRNLSHLTVTDTDLSPDFGNFPLSVLSHGLKWESRACQLSQLSETAQAESEKGCPATPRARACHQGTAKRGNMVKHAKDTVSDVGHLRSGSLFSGVAVLKARPSGGGNHRTSGLPSCHATFLIGLSTPAVPHL